MIGRLKRLARRFAGRREGNIAIITASLGSVCIFVTCMAVDYTMACQRQDQLQGYADAAALTTTTPVAMQGTAAAAQAAAVAAFNGQAGTLAGVTSPTATITVNDSNPGGASNVRTTTVTFTGNSKTMFSTMLGISSFPLKGGSAATMGSTPYINIYVLLDNSQSMGIASTTTDMTNLYNVTQTQNNDGCVFGCHVALAGESYSDEALAHSNNVTLRIDSAKTAIDTMLNLATSQDLSNKVQFAIYTMGGGDTSSTNLFDKISTLSNNYSTLQSDVTNIDLENGALGVIGDTDIEAAMKKLLAVLPTSNGDGSTQAKAINYVFVVTDGLDDYDTYSASLPCLNNAPSPGGYRCTTNLPTTECTKLAKVANVGVIYTPYLPLYNNDDSSQGYYSSYSSLVEPYDSSIPTNLQNCATSSSLYMTASDGPAIVAAMTTLFGRAINAPYLTS